jgi:cell wall-associated NlpC family hydrolase
LNFRYRTADAKNWENDDFKKVDAKNVQPGDVVLFNGHLGIVQSFNSATGAGEFMGSQTSTGPKVAKFSTNNP